MDAALLRLLQEVLTPDQVPFVLASLAIYPWVNDLATMPVVAPAPSGPLHDRVHQIGRRYVSVFALECFQLVYSPWWAPLSWWSRNYPIVLLVAWSCAGVVLSLRLAFTTTMLLTKTLLGLLAIPLAVLLAATFFRFLGQRSTR